MAEPSIPPGRQVVTKADIRAAGTQAWALNNTALKSIRDSHENPLGVPSVSEVDPILTSIKFSR